jgi:hypothetical protein
MRPPLTVILTITCPLICLAHPKPHLSIIPGPVGDQALLFWRTQPGLEYGIEKANELGGIWTRCSTVNADGFSKSWVDPVPLTTSAFYRIAHPPLITSYAILGDSRGNQSGLRPNEGAVGLTYWINLALGRRLACIENLNPLNAAGPRYAFSQGGQYFGSLEKDGGL